MYYTINNAIGTEVIVNNQTLVCGNIYDNKVKAPKDVDYILAFSKTDEGWRFDGKADLDAEQFATWCEENPVDACVLAWKAEKINIQSKIRPSKDSKKALATQARNTAIAEIEAQFKSGEIDAETFGKLAIEIATSM